MPRRKLGERILGPYPRKGERAGFRLVHVRADGSRVDSVWPTEADAHAAKRGAEAEVAAQARAVGDGIKRYEQHLIAKGNKDRSRTETLRRLRLFFLVGEGEKGRAFDMLTPGAMKARYAELAAKYASSDTHRNYLAEARTFLEWCRGEGWIRSNPLELVKGTGKRKHGKPQLRIDESRTWLRRALDLADGGEEGALAAVMTLVLAMRCGEVVSRQARDVDDDAKLLWIPDSKTAAGRRTLEVPELLQPLLREQAAHKKGTGWLFPGDSKEGHRSRAWPREWVARICGMVGVPRVTAHGMRGLHATIALERGSTGRAVADALGHEDQSTTRESYAAPHAGDAAKRRKTFKLLTGGRALPEPRKVSK